MTEDTKSLHLLLNKLVVTRNSILMNGTNYRKWCTEIQKYFVDILKVGFSGNKTLRFEFDIVTEAWRNGKCKRRLKLSGKP